MSRSRTVVAAGTTGLLAAAVVAGLGAAAGPAQAAVPCGTGGVFTASAPVCTYTTVGTDTFTVPDGVTELSFDLFGGAGGSAAGFVTPNPPNTGAPGGLGGHTRATLTVSPGQVLQVTVGDAGVNGTSQRGRAAQPGGLGHGSGGFGGHGGGGSGGGGSDVRVGAFGTDDRVLVAGGGGGAGNGGPLLRGGNGGGLVGEPGGAGGGPPGSGTSGGGGTQTSPGAEVPHPPGTGGPGGAGGTYVDFRTGELNPGSGGGGGNGGAGGNGGGGGGGGYFGGSGGSGGGNPDNFYGAGGGGASSYAAPAATGVSLIPGVNHGSGKVIVSFRYGTSISLTPSTSTPLFGRPVTVNATVSSANPAEGPPSGTVTFSDGATPLATVPLDGGQASFSTSKLQPGAHSITASYSGDPSFTPSATAGPTAVTVGFSQPCLTTVRNSPLKVVANQSFCIGAGGKQQGPVSVEPGGALAVLGAEITGPVSTKGALAVTICESTLRAPVTVQGTSGYVLVGSDHTGAVACPGNTFEALLTVDGNTGGVEVSGNRITSPVKIINNSGSGLLPEEAVPAFAGNHVTAPLSCSGNTPALRQTGNTVTGPRSGQCQ